MVPQIHRRAQGRGGFHERMREFEHDADGGERG